MYCLNICSLHHLCFLQSRTSEFALNLSHLYCSKEDFSVSICSEYNKIYVFTKSSFTIPESSQVLYNTTAAFRGYHCWRVNRTIILWFSMHALTSYSCTGYSGLRTSIQSEAVIHKATLNDLLSTLRPDCHGVFLQSLYFNRLSLRKSLLHFTIHAV